MNEALYGILNISEDRKHLTLLSPDHKKVTVALEIPLPRYPEGNYLMLREDEYGNLIDDRLTIEAEPDQQSQETA